MVISRPYFMTNKDWYYYDFEKGILRLTDDAPEEAVKSYNETYKMLDDNLKGKDYVRR